MTKRKYAILTEGAMMTIAVKNYLREKGILESMDSELPTKGVFVTIPVNLVPSLKIALDLGIMEVKYEGKAEILQQKVGA